MDPKQNPITGPGYWTAIHAYNSYILKLCTTYLAIWLLYFDEVDLWYLHQSNLVYGMLLLIHFGCYSSK